MLPALRSIDTIPYSKLRFIPIQNRRPLSVAPRGGAMAVRRGEADQRWLPCGSAIWSGY